MSFRIEDFADISLKFSVVQIEGQTGPQAFEFDIGLDMNIPFAEGKGFETMPPALHQKVVEAKQTLVNAAQTVVSMAMLHSMVNDPTVSPDVIGGSEPKLVTPANTKEMN